MSLYQWSGPSSIQRVPGSIWALHHPYTSPAMKSGLLGLKTTKNYTQFYINIVGDVLGPARTRWWSLLRPRWLPSWGHQPPNLCLARPTSPASLFITSLLNTKVVFAVVFVHLLCIGFLLPRLPSCPESHLFFVCWNHLFSVLLTNV